MTITYKQLMARGQKKMEIILYAGLWAVLFAVPVASMLITDTAQSAELDWQGVYDAWQLLVMFFVAFVVHNFLLAPLLVYGNRRWAYGISLVFLLAAFAFYQLNLRPHQPEPRKDDRRRPVAEATATAKTPLHEMAPKPDAALHGMEPKPKAAPHELADNGGGFPPSPNEAEGPGQPPPDAGKFDRTHEKKPEPPRAFGGQDTVAFIIVVLLLGVNVGIKYFFKSLDDKKRIKELERENLNRQLEYLKYQINPHFFMNTLNNIHALVDIDPEQAKYTIEVLSKLMRYVLYEGNKTMAPLQKELGFIGHYVDLMRIRYTDKVRISVSLPQSVPDVLVPSLLFTTFVENAFKHGVSYQKDSFIEVSVNVDETTREISFSCCNSRKPEKEEGHGGVGLSNAKKRLQLIYGDDYELSVNSNEEEYRLLLRLPGKFAD